MNDPEIRLNGYQFTGRNYANSVRGGMLIFTHQREQCGTTLAVYARMLKENDADPHAIQNGVGVAAGNSETE